MIKNETNIHLYKTRQIKPRTNLTYHRTAHSEIDFLTRWTIAWTLLRQKISSWKIHCTLEHVKKDWLIHLALRKFLKRFKLCISLDSTQQYKVVFIDTHVPPTDLEAMYIEMTKRNNLELVLEIYQAYDNMNHETINKTDVNSCSNLQRRLHSNVCEIKKWKTVVTMATK